jgi:hypothetical protein
MKAQSIEYWLNNEVPEPHRSHLLRLTRNRTIGQKLDGQKFLTFTGAIITLMSVTTNYYGDELSPSVKQYMFNVSKQANPNLPTGRRDWSFSDEAVVPPARTEEVTTSSTHTDEATGISQNKTIFNHMKTKGGITQLQATRLYNITRLAPRISDLKRAGHIIDREMIPTGKFGKYARYFLVEEAK